MLKRIVIVVTVVGLCLTGPSPSHAVERTTDFVFKTFERIAGRSTAYKRDVVQLQHTIDQAQARMQEIRTQLDQAQAAGDEVAQAKQRANLMVERARYLRAHAARMKLAQENFRASRDDLESLLPGLERQAAQLGRSTDRQQFVSDAVSFGENMKAIIGSYAQATDDPLVQAQLAAALNSLKILRYQLQTDQASAAGSLTHFIDTVRGYITTLDSALVQVEVGAKVLQNKRIQLQAISKVEAIDVLRLRLDLPPIHPGEPLDLLKPVLEPIAIPPIQTSSSPESDARPGNWSLQAELEEIDFNDIDL